MNSLDRRNTEKIGLIPAAGKGIRLGLPYPKELYPIIRENRYKPIAQFVLENLIESGIEHIVFVINETKHQLIGYFGNGLRFGCQISYVVQESADEQLNSRSPGLAHALDSAYHLTQGKTVYFGMADTIMTPNDVYSQAARIALPDDDVILSLFPTERPQKFGMVQMDNEGTVEQIVDKPAQTELRYMWGCIIWGSRFSEFLHQKVRDEGLGDFARIMNEAVTSGMTFRGVPFDTGTYIDLGTYDEIMELDLKFRDRV
jgi:glucose-1-phosphate thymidylyltransferase